MSEVNEIGAEDNQRGNVMGEGIVMQNSIFDTDKRFKKDWTNSLGIHQLFITRSWFHSPEVALKFL